MITFDHPTPILRMFDEAKAREFYRDFLGFTVNFEHRFGENFPLYLEVQRGDCRLHLSEHHGDGSPGVVLRIEVTGIDALSVELRGKDYRYAKPGTPNKGVVGREITLTDPSGNRLILFER